MSHTKHVTASCSPHPCTHIATTAMHSAMSHVPFVNESYHTRECDMSHGPHVARLIYVRVTNVNTKCHTYPCARITTGTIHPAASHSIYMNESCHTSGCVTSPITVHPNRDWGDTHCNESCPINTRMSRAKHVRMRHVTRTYPCAAIYRNCTHAHRHCTHTY